MCYILLWQLKTLLHWSRIHKHFKSRRCNIFVKNVEVIYYKINVGTAQSFKVCLFVFLFWRDSPQLARASSFTRFLNHTQRRTTVGRTPLDKWSARRRDLYPTTHNNHNRPTSIPPGGFEPTISTGERPQTYSLGRAATRTGKASKCTWLNVCLCSITPLRIEYSEVKWAWQWTSHLQNFPSYVQPFAYRSEAPPFNLLAP